MAESRHHQRLVMRAVKAVCATAGNDQIIELRADLPGGTYATPPTIYGHRPDLYATAYGLTIIGEAKPPWDIESTKTELQLTSFIRYVEMYCSRHLILAVNWVSAGTINGVVRNIARDWPSLKQRIHILDGRRPLVLPMMQRDHVTN